MQLISSVSTLAVSSIRKWQLINNHLDVHLSAFGMSAGRLFDVAATFVEWPNGHVFVPFAYTDWRLVFRWFAYIYLFVCLLIYLVICLSVF